MITHSIVDVINEESGSLQSRRSTQKINCSNEIVPSRRNRSKNPAGLRRTSRNRQMVIEMINVYRCIFCGGIWIAREMEVDTVGVGEELGRVKGEGHTLAPAVRKKSPWKDQWQPIYRLTGAGVGGSHHQRVGRLPYAANRAIPPSFSLSLSSSLSLSLSLGLSLNLSSFFFLFLSYSLLFYLFSPSSPFISLSVCQLLSLSLSFTSPSYLLRQPHTQSLLPNVSGEKGEEHSCSSDADFASAHSTRQQQSINVGNPVRLIQAYPFFLRQCWFGCRVALLFQKLPIRFNSIMLFIW